MTEQQIASCAGKGKFASHAQAAARAKRMRRKNSGAKLDAYKCSTCGHWRIGSTAYVRAAG